MKFPTALLLSGPQATFVFTMAVVGTMFTGYTIATAIQSRRKSNA